MYPETAPDDGTPLNEPMYIRCSSWRLVSEEEIMVELQSFFPRAETIAGDLDEVGKIAERIVENADSDERKRFVKEFLGRPEKAHAFATSLSGSAILGRMVQQWQDQLMELLAALFWEEEEIRRLMKDKNGSSIIAILWNWQEEELRKYFRKTIVYALEGFALQLSKDENGCAFVLNALHEIGDSLGDELWQTPGIVQVLENSDSGRQVLDALRENRYPVDERKNNSRPGRGSGCVGHADVATGARTPISKPKSKQKRKPQQKNLSQNPDLVDPNLCFFPQQLNMPSFMFPSSDPFVLQSLDHSQANAGVWRGEAQYFEGNGTGYFYQ